MTSIKKLSVLLAVVVGMTAMAPIESMAQSRRERPPGARPTPPPGGGGGGGGSHSPPPPRERPERPPRDVRPAPPVPPRDRDVRPAPAPPRERPPRDVRPAPPIPPRDRDVTPVPPRPPRDRDVRPVPVPRPPRDRDVTPVPPRPPRDRDVRPVPVPRPPRDRDVRPVPVPRPPRDVRPGPIPHRPPVDRDFVRDSIRRDREHRAADRRMVRERVDFGRRDWRVRTPIVVHRDVRWIRSSSTWAHRHSRWITHTYRPSAPIFSRPPRWYAPVPDFVDTFEGVEQTAVNMENIARDVYDTMNGVIHTNPNREYAERLMRVLGELIDASENYTDVIYDGQDPYETINDLFYLESKVDLAIDTLDGYSKEYLVEDEMKAMKYYVDELLWVYYNQY